MLGIEGETKLLNMNATPNENGNTDAIQIITPIKTIESDLFCFQERRVSLCLTTLKKGLL